MVRKYFSKNEIIKRLRAIGEKLPRPVKIYMIGGGAMGLKGEKDITKDIDIILTNSEDIDIFIKALKALGYYDITSVAEEYARLQVKAHLRDKEYFLFDIFLNKVCNALELSNAMRERAERYGSFGNVQLYILAREDIFLFKSITERNRDLEDMLTLLRKGIDENIIAEECKNQRIKSGRIWEAFVAIKIKELEERYRLTIPWKRKLIKIGEEETAKCLIINKIKEKENTAEEIAAELSISYNFVRKILNELESSKEVIADRSKRPYRYLMSK